MMSMVDVVVAMERLGTRAGLHRECDRRTELGWGYGTSWCVAMLHVVSPRFQSPISSVRVYTQ